MTEFEKEVLSDMSKMIRIHTDCPLPPDRLWMKLENATTITIVTFLAMWWLATIIKF